MTINHRVVGHWIVLRKCFGLLFTLFSYTLVLYYTVVSNVREDIHYLAHSERHRLKLMHGRKLCWGWRHWLPVSLMCLFISVIFALFIYLFTCSTHIQIAKPSTWSFVCLVLVPTLPPFRVTKESVYLISCYLFWPVPDYELSQIHRSPSFFLSF